MKVAVNTAKLLRNVPLPDEIATVHENAVVIDMGTSLTRIGFSGEDAPRRLYQTVIGRGADGTTECFNAAYRARESLAVKPVMKRGLVEDWDGWTLMMRNLYDQLNLHKDPNAPLLLSEVALAPREQRERMVQILFEDIQSQALYFSTAPVLSLYASGRTSGTVIEMGYESCHTVPVFEGFGLFHSFLELDLGGSHLTSQVGQIIAKHNPAATFAKAFENDIHQFVKETYCQAQPDAGSYALATAEANRGDVAQCTLPDGTTLRLGTERYSVTEGLFNPSVIGREHLRGIQHLALESVGKCDGDITAALLGNVVLSGGTSLFAGISDRINRELQSLAVVGGKVSGDKVRVYAATERRHAAWVGGSIMASLPTFQDFWITKAEYDESGPDIRKALGHRNCF